MKALLKIELCTHLKSDDKESGGKRINILEKGKEIGH